MGQLLREDDATPSVNFQESTALGCSGLFFSFAFPSCFISVLLEISYSSWIHWLVGRASDFSFSGVDWTLLVCLFMPPLWAFALVSAVYEASDFWHTRVHGKLQTWPAFSRITGIIGWLSIAAFMNIVCLEAAEKDEVEAGVSGVHILLGLFRVVLGMICFLAAIVILHWREQQFPRFPHSARRCGGRRLLLRPRRGGGLTRSFVALFLLGNLVGAEFVTAHQQWQHIQNATSTVPAAAVDDEARDASWPCGRSGLHSGCLSLNEGFRPRFGFGEFCREGHDTLGHLFDHEVCQLQTDERSAPGHYQMSGRAVNSAGPNFVGGGLTPNAPPVFWCSVRQTYGSVSSTCTAG